jgi:hypothetical protein
MKDTFCKREYKCKCGITIEDYVWQSSIKEHTIKCKCNKEIGYNNLIINNVVKSASIRTPTKNR